MPPMPAGMRPSNPIALQRWSTQTLILLSSSVGLTTYLIGFSSGYSTGVKKAAEAAGLPPPPTAVGLGVAPPPQFVAETSGPASPAQS
ncbi:unnamed protein product [Tilletia controversa]|uniref:Uncharacterized protein n=3 Tax=Tilletia TaxID=13289 RepID=A0A8X7N1P3_9BASI|nr:hypothetical protein CF336_g4020 [Tilletia laevis]KAE8205912.1 hypothetical protein CF328_g210 [Tilletia controversa]KAE8261514.1 hypothetical protein A4X03_0g3186 [Tilletia caries]KAE8202993.1 hypothetical protein CF335_g3202 [Tilletia laevis]KAE8255624.1 hypothetical protein A4X06_0g333 [Tilletia controversa]